VNYISLHNADNHTKVVVNRHKQFISAGGIVRKTIPWHVRHPEKDWNQAYCWLAFVTTKNGDKFEYPTVSIDELTNARVSERLFAQIQPQIYKYIEGVYGYGQMSFEDLTDYDIASAEFYFVELLDGFDEMANLRGALTFDERDIINVYPKRGRRR